MVIELPVVSPMNAPRSAYIHIPFCRHRCGYCNFTVLAGRQDLHRSYLNALKAELALLGEPVEVDTVYLGGGTPTELQLSEFHELMELVKFWFPLAVDGEFTTEANPEDITPEYVQLFQKFGINRVSLGGQSFDESKLAVLERNHSPVQLKQCFELLSPIDSISMDLIFGVPGESLQQWETDLKLLLEYQPTHLSTYGLTIEKGTPFWSRFENGELEELSDDLQREFYLTARHMLTEHSYHHYEVSNYAKPGFECRHNEAYWFGEPYFAAGPGAARYVDGFRQVNHRSTTTYIRKALEGKSVVAESEHVTGEELYREILVFALRRLDGITDTWFQQKTGMTPWELAGEQLEKFIEQGFFQRTGDQLCLTEEGLLVSDSLWPHLL